MAVQNARKRDRNRNPCPRWNGLYDRLADETDVHPWFLHVRTKPFTPIRLSAFEGLPSIDQLACRIGRPVRREKALDRAEALENPQRSAI